MFVTLLFYVLNQTALCWRYTFYCPLLLNINYSPTFLCTYQRTGCVIDEHYKSFYHFHIIFLKIQVCSFWKAQRVSSIHSPLRVSWSVHLWPRVTLKRIYWLKTMTHIMDRLSGLHNLQNATLHVNSNIGLYML